MKHKGAKHKGKLWIVLAVLVVGVFAQTGKQDASKNDHEAVLSGETEPEAYRKVAQTEADQSNPVSTQITEKEPPQEQTEPPEGNAVQEESSTENVAQFLFDLSLVPAYTGNSYVELNQNQPLFDEDDMVTTPFENYSRLDELGRCGEAYANLCGEEMPTEERGEIGSVRPSGWHTVKYNDLIDGNYLYNRCHLIGYQLAGENANEKNLITGTRYLNVEGMLPFENRVADYLKSSKNHVLYRVTPIYEGDNLVASGVTMEAKSVEDEGEGICFYVFVYNVQPGILIDYADGSSLPDAAYAGQYGQNPEKDRRTENENAAAANGAYSNVTDSTATEKTYILNTNTHKFHDPSCSSVSDMKEKNKKVTTDTRESVIASGYAPCKRCDP